MMNLEVCDGKTKDSVNNLSHISLGGGSGRRLSSRVADFPIHFL